MDALIPRGTTVFPALVAIHFDGACQPPRGGGVAAYGFTVVGENLDHEESGLAVPPGSDRSTNNVAEYTGAIRALEYLRSKGYRGTVVVIGDSQLVIRQMSGEYQVRAEHLRSYHERLETLASEFEDVRFNWVPRELNQRADELSKEAVDRATADPSVGRIGRRPAGTVPRSPPP